LSMRTPSISKITPSIIRSSDKGEYGTNQPETSPESGFVPGRFGL
jgi:hypothetical protein